MNRVTLAQVRSNPGLSSIGLCATNIAGIAAAVNEAQERLLNDPLTPDEGWWGGWATMLFTVTIDNRTGYITAPREVARIILLDVCQHPVRIRNGFYEYLQFGTGLQPKNTGGNCTRHCDDHHREAFERDNVVTLSPLLSTPQLIRIYPTDPADVGKSVLVQGEDQNSMVILSQDIKTQQSILGEQITLDDPFVTTANQFSTITGLQKDITIGPLTFFQVDPTTGVQTALSSMEPNETASSYRRYFLNGMPPQCCNTSSGTVQVSAQVRFELIPVMSDSDYLLIQSVPAIIEEMQSNRYGRMDTEKAAQLEAKHHARAIQLLNGQLDHVLGKENTAVQVHLFGSDRVKLQPI